MEKKHLKKWVIEKETIANLSKFQQGMVWGGYDEESFGGGTCGSKCETWCAQDKCFDNKTNFVCPPNTKDDGGTCDSSVDWAVSCQGFCSVDVCP